MNNAQIKKNRLNKHASESHPAWMVTFADLMALLMGFFVILLASSNFEKPKFDIVGQSMSETLHSMRFNYSNPTLAHIPTNEPVIVPSVPKFSLAYEQMISGEQQRATIADTQFLVNILQPQLKAHQLEIEREGLSIIIRLPQSGIFPPGGAALDESFKPVLTTIRENLKTIPGTITVSGYTDNTPISNSQFESNWELSSARAASVLNVLLAFAEIPQDRFVLKGYGPTSPRVPNSSAANKALNRRVEIVINQSDVDRSLIKPSNLIPHELPW